MQKPFAYSPVHKIAQVSSLSRRQLSIIAIAGVIMVFVISFALVIRQFGKSDSAAHSNLSSSSAFSSGMPLP
jgi:hypothetical protein